MEQETNTPIVATETPSTVNPNKSIAHQLTKGSVYGMIIFGIILFGAIVVVLSNPKTSEIAMQSQIPEAPALVADTATAALSTQGKSDAVSDIEKDLNSTDLSSLNDIDNI